MIRRLTVVMLLLLAVTACGGRSTRPSCPLGKLCLHAGQNSEPGTLDPAKAQLVPEENILTDLFVGLVTDNEKGEPIPGVATSWTTSPDGLVWTFKLRDSQWSDGQPVTADDFVYALRRLADPRTAAEYAYFSFVIKNAALINAGKAPLEALGARALDARTLQLDLAHPTPYLPQILANPSTDPVPAHVVRKWGDAWLRPEHYVSNGPFALNYWRLGDRLRLVKNPRFYDAANVCLDEVYYYPATDLIAAERRVRRGELDMHDTVQSNRIPFLKRPDQVPAYVRVATYLGTGYMVFNNHNPALADRRVRTALAMTADREFITSKLLRAGQPPAYSFVPPGVAGYPGGTRLFYQDWPFTKRLAYARGLLAQAGYGPTRPLKIELNLSNGNDGVVYAPALQADWRSIGVEATLNQQDLQIFYGNLAARSFDVALVNWIADYDDATTFLALLKSDTGAQNYGDYKNPAFDTLLAQADQTADAKARAALLVRAEQIALDDVGVAPLYFWVSRNLVNPTVTGWTGNIVDHHPKRWVCFSDAAARRAGRR